MIFILQLNQSWYLQRISNDLQFIEIENLDFNRLFILIDLIIIVVELNADNVLINNILDLILIFYRFFKIRFRNYRIILTKIDIFRWRLKFVERWKKFVILIAWYINMRNRFYFKFFELMWNRKRHKFIVVVWQRFEFFFAR